MCGVLLGLLLISGSCFAQTAELGSLPGVAISVLQQRLRESSAISSDDLLQQMAQETGLSRSEISEGLLGLLDSLDYQRRRESEIWKGIIAVGGDEIPPKKADKFLQELFKSARDILQKNVNYSLQSVLEQSAKKVRIMPVSGQRLSYAPSGYRSG